jgi:hypothetical protein
VRLALGIEQETLSEKLKNKQEELQRGSSGRGQAQGPEIKL